jgi:predicted Zn-dependent peptidase
VDSIETFTLSCGAVLVVERIGGAASAAMSWLFPVGSAGDPPTRLGEAAMLNEYTSRGAGGLTSRAHSDALDRAGVERGSHVGTHHLAVSATFLGSRAGEVLPLFAMIATDLAIEEDALEPVRSLCIQAIESLKDDPQHLAMLRLRERHLPPPFNRHGHGEIEHLHRMTTPMLRAAWSARATPRGSIIAVAGAVNPAAVRAQLEQLLARWNGAAIEPKEASPPQRGIGHEEQPSAQVHIGVAWDAPPERDRDSMVERVGINVLSGGMSGRLFTEVREKRSLCYSVNAAYSAGRGRGYVALYAGTTPERAEQTLEVSIAEVEKLRDGVTEAEYQRAIIGLKSRLVMQGESTSARASALAHDFYKLGRARTLDEVSAEVDRVTLERLNGYLESRALGPMTVFSIGPKPLQLR